MAPPVDVLVAVGAPGNAEYAEIFERQVDGWREACRRGAREIAVLSPATKEALEAALVGAVAEESADPLWIIFVGHGTFDGREAKFNLEGDDATPSEVADWLGGAARPIVFINTTASSAPFLHALSGADRVVVTATKDASEASFAHFGKFLAAAVADSEADLDQDGATSLLEAFLVASRRTQAFFEADRRLASEEAMIDDNGDGRGTLAKAFDGLLSTQEAATAETERLPRLPDGVRAHQISLVPSDDEAGRSPEWKADRDRLELELFALRNRKDELEEQIYLGELESVLVKLADLYLDGQVGGEEAGDGDQENGGAANP
ncbi:hypothetical protein BH23VER1_BH23VER1_27060 [soil metagenome]